MDLKDFFSAVRAIARGYRLAYEAATRKSGESARGQDGTHCVTLAVARRVRPKGSTVRCCGSASWSVTRFPGFRNETLPAQAITIRG